VTDRGELPHEWSRLHPLSPLIRASRATAALATVVVVDAATRHRPHWADGVAVLIAAVAGLVYWLVTRWRVHDGELQLTTGLIRRRQVRVPLTRVQGVDLVRPLLARLLGASELRLVLAGHHSEVARLSYLSSDRAAAVRARLIALAHGLSEDTPEPPERSIIAVRNGRIVAANLLSTRFVVGVLVIATAIGLLFGGPRGIGAVIAPLLVTMVSAVLVTARQIAAEWAFEAAEAPDGLRLRSGLTQTRAETVPHGRVQAVRWVEPLWWRPFGWVRLEFDVARHRNADRGDRQSGMTSRALLPVGSREEARWMLSRVLPGVAAELTAADGVPTRTRWRAPLARRFARVHYDTTYIACCTGRVRPDTVMVPLSKIQSIRWSQGAWSRRLGLASVHVDAAGHRFTATARFRDAAQAAQLVATLPDLARAARSKVTPR
jgi:putative membrane protein